MALWAAKIQVEVREISLRDKPAHLLQISPKGTVPVLQLPEGAVLDQSLDIMQWALAQTDPQGWLNPDRDAIAELITINDGDFKKALDRYKYPERYPEQQQLFYRQQGEQFLQALETVLQQHRFLLSDSASVADVAIFPFIRQFAAVDAEWFAGSAYPQLRAWLNGWLESALFVQIMQKFPTYIEST
jgi:glutathione S-transferase